MKTGTTMLGERRWVLGGEGTRDGSDRARREGAVEDQRDADAAAAPAGFRSAGLGIIGSG